MMPASIEEHMEKRNDAIDDDEEDDDEVEQQGDEPVMLGFVEKPTGPIFGRGFPSKAGGKPLWYPNRAVPSIEELTCPSCNDPLRFVLQIYAPFTEMPQSHHRSLYLFCCRNGSCLESNPNSVKVFRFQSGRRSQAKEGEDSEGEDSADEVTAEDEPWTGVPLCDLCGFPARSKCGACHTTRYCSKYCQKADWRAGHSKACPSRNPNPNADILANQEAGRLQCLFPELSIEMEEEPESAVKGEEEQDLSKAKELEQAYLKEKSDHQGEEDDDMDDENLDGLTNQSVDKLFRAFQKRIACCKDQCIRYPGDPNTTPLWVGKQGIPSANQIAPCKCGKARTFEFQILPQLLYFLKVGNHKDSIDWGTLAVYSCPDSCEQGDYAEEIIWRQPPHAPCPFNDSTTNTNTNTVSPSSSSSSSSSSTSSL